MAEKYYNLSPYAYCANNPVNFVDPDGRFIGFISDVVSVGIGVRSFAKNISAGNIRGAVWDGVGVVVDVVAAAIPVVPGGVGYVRAGINAADNAIDAAKAVNAVDNTADVAKAVEATDNLPKVTTGSTTPLEILPENQIDRNLLDKPAKRGNAFVFKDDGTPVEIHHENQGANGPYKEMHRNDHRGKGNYKKITLH